ncbi:PREDICTED: probable ATP-dependent RNA helicase DDX28 [Nicrophorus vespilloides]|uniref:Probable ATP-dependent RNA helicase DDX28 n=1 Tax=Nicrophorus vespilloides TaxID=110193 RepID=A0ABM1M4Y3_NICVS|nr:PREDICTED: probable ATP-dependent RNA helicase DDX28 [Nicrophorus vespilloides]
MNFKHWNRLCYNILKQKQYYSTKPKGKLIISCKRSKFDFYSNQQYDKFEEIQLASKGWFNNAAKGDYFVVHGNKEEYEEPTVPFSHLGVNSQLAEVLHNEGIYKLTEFQSDVIPVVAEGKHTLLAAETGCGKTLSYLLPLVQNLIGYQCTEMNTPRVLILVPNRELAHQIGNVATTLCEPFDLKTKVVVGGSTKRLMLDPEFGSIDILVATPGAISKLSTVGIYKLNQVKTLVLDEADTLIDDSFLDRIEILIRRVSQAQVLLVSATYPKHLPEVMEPIMDSLVQIKSRRLHKPLLNVTQRFLKLLKSERPSQLLQIANKTKEPFIVFTNRNETCNWLAMFLRENGLKCANINGDMNYNIRINQWNDFVSGKANILSATDVGSRGLDTTKVKHVLNYDFPLYPADYIHRVGRTGRLGSPELSKVTNFISSGIDVKLVQNIEMAIRTNSELQNVDGNITSIVKNKIAKQMKGRNI